VLPFRDMTVLEALPILEAATLECKMREVDTPELRAALDFLEPHIQPARLIPQFRHNLDGERGHEYAAREGQQQGGSYRPRLLGGPLTKYFAAK